MIRQRVSLAVAGTFIATAALTAGLASPATAAPTIYDPAFVPGATDLVGVGSDTSEIVLDYLTKGHAGVDGFNTGKSSGRVASFAAGTDPATIVLRDGLDPITRPNGSGAGKSLLRPATINNDVNFARSSSTLSPAEITDSLKQIPFAVDGLKLAVSSTVATHAPATITPAQMVSIYKGEVTNWSELGGTAGVIKPLIPQTGSGTRSFFVAQLKASNGGVDVVLGGAVTETQEHSPTDIQNDANAVAPFSTGRAKSNPTIALITGAGSFTKQRALYNVFRNADLSGDDNATLIASVFGESGFICSPAAKPLIEAAGFEQLASTDVSGACGEAGTADITNFTTAPDTTTTVLAAEALNGNKVKLTATVAGDDPEAESPDGDVVFKEEGDVVATETVDLNAENDTVAVATLDEVTDGEHTYTAEFVPADENVFGPSVSSSASATVLTDSLVTVGIFNPTATFGTTRLVAISATADRQPATGSVKLKVDDGAEVTVPLIGESGAGFYTIPGTTGVGAHTVTVTFAGNSSVFGDSTTAPLTVTKATTKSVFKFSDATIKAKTTPQATATITIVGGSVKPAGTVQFKNGSKVIGTGTVSSAGTVKVNLKKFKKGTYKIRATFTPNAGNAANYSGSSSSYVTIKVSK